MSIPAGISIETVLHSPVTRLNDYVCAPFLFMIIWLQLVPVHYTASIHLPLKNACLVGVGTTRIRELHIRLFSESS